MRLRRAVRRDQLRVFGLKLLEPLDKPVVFEVGNLRSRLDVVFPIVPRDHLTEPGNFRRMRWATWLSPSTTHHTRRLPRKTRARRGGDGESGTRTSTARPPCCGTDGADSVGRTRPYRVQRNARGPLRQPRRPPRARTVRAHGHGHVSGCGHPDATTKKRIEKLGAASFGPIRQHIRQFSAPSASTGAALICSQWTIFINYLQSPWLPIVPQPAMEGRQASWKARRQAKKTPSLEQNCQSGYTANDPTRSPATELLRCEKRTPGQRLPAPYQPPPRRPKPPLSPRSYRRMTRRTVRDTPLL